MLQKIKCLFGNHDSEVFESKIVTGTLLGQIVKASHWKCVHCGHIGNWTVTETL